MAGLNFIEALMQLFLCRDLCRTGPASHAEQLRQRLDRAVVDHAQTTGKDGQERLQPAQALQESGTRLFHFG